MTLDLTSTYALIYETLLADLVSALHAPDQPSTEMISLLRGEVALARLQAYGTSVAY